MLEMYEQDAYLEMIAQRHEARLILTDEVKSPVKRDYLKYQKECHVIKKPIAGTIGLDLVAHAP